jgi:hypothetical protein
MENVIFESWIFLASPFVEGHLGSHLLVSSIVGVWAELCGSYIHGIPSKLDIHMFSSVHIYPLLLYTLHKLGFIWTLNSI